MTQTIAYLEAVVGADITDFRRGMQDVRRQTGILSDTFNGIAGGFSQAGRALTFSVTVPIMAALGASLNLASEFDGAMRNINSIAQLPEGQFRALSEQVLEFGINTRTGAQGAAEALYEVYSAGVTGQEAFDIMAVSVKTAEGGLADLSKTTNALTATMLAFRNQGLTIEDASNIWSRMVQLGVGSLEDFLANSQKVLPAASALGISFEDIGINAAFLSQQGGGAKKAMTALGMLMSNLLKPNLTLAEAYDELGVATGQELIAKFGSLEDAIKAVRDVTESDVDFAKMFSKTGLEAVLAITNNWDALQDTIVQFRDGLDEATETAFQQQMMSFPAIMDRFKSAVEGLGIVIGTVLIPILTPLIEGFTKFVLEMSKVSPELLKLIVGFALAAAAAGPILWIIGSLLSPVGLLAGSVAILATAFSTNFMGIRDTVSNAVTEVLGDLNPLKEAIENFFGTLFDDTTTVNLAAVNTTVDMDKGTFGSRLSYAIETAWPAVEAALADIWNNIKTWIVETGVPLLDSVGGDVTNGIAGIFDASESTGAGDGPLYQSIRSIFTTDIGAIGNEIGGWFQEMFPDTVAGIQNVFSNVGGWLRAEGIPSLVRTIGYGIGTIITAIPNFLINIGTSIADALSSENVNQTINDAVLLMMDLGSGLGDAFEDSGLKDKIETFANNLRAFIDVATINLGLSIKSAFTLLGRDIRMTINDFFMNLFGVAAGLVDQIPEQLFPGGAAAKEFYYQAFSNATQDLAKNLHIDQFLGEIEAEINAAAQSGKLMLDLNKLDYGVHDFSFESSNINAETIAAGMTEMGKSQLMVMVNQALQQSMAGDFNADNNLRVLLPIAIQAGFRPEDMAEGVDASLIPLLQQAINDALADTSLTNSAQNAYYQFLQSIMGTTGLDTNAVPSADLMADTFGAGAVKGSGSGGGLANAIKAKIEGAFTEVKAMTMKNTVPIKPATDADIGLAVAGTVTKITTQTQSKTAALTAVGANMTKSVALGMKTTATTSFAAGGDGDIATPVKTMTDSMQSSFVNLFSPAGQVVSIFNSFRGIMMGGLGQLGSAFWNLSNVANYTRSVLSGVFNGAAGAMAGAIGQMLGILGSLIGQLNQVQAAANAAADAVAKAANAPPPAKGGTKPGAKASGGTAQGLTWVGERGPELLNLGQPGTVVTNSAVRNMVQGSNGDGGGNVINVYGVQDVDKMLYELKRRGIVLA